MKWFINIINKIRQKYWEVTTCNPPYDCPFCMHCYDKSIKDLLEETPEPKMRKVEEGLVPFREPTKEELEIVENYKKKIL